METPITVSLNIEVNSHPDKGGNFIHVLINLLCVLTEINELTLSKEGVSTWRITVKSVTT